MFPEVSNDSERESLTFSDNLQRVNKRSSWKIAKDLPTSFLYAAKGLRYAFSTQRNFRIHVGFALLAFALGLLLSIYLLRKKKVNLLLKPILIETRMVKF